MKKQNIFYKYTLGLTFLGFLAGFVLLNLLTPDKVFSEQENRMLEQKPEFSLTNLFHDRFTKSYEKYISDQFALRDFWIGIKSDAEVALGKKENNGVLLGKDGYLLDKFSKPEDSQLAMRVEALNTFAVKNPETRIFFMLVPNSVKVLGDKLPAYAPVDDELLSMNKVEAALNKNIKCIDVYHILAAKKNEYIYYKTDHHWTTKGAFYSYEEAAKVMGFSPQKLADFNIKQVTSDFFGTLYSKSGFRNVAPDSIELYLPKNKENWKVEYSDKKFITDSLYMLDNLQKKDKYTVFLGGNHPYMHITSNGKINSKILVIKDSYANSFIPFLTEHYKDIYVVDPRYYREDINELIKAKDIKDVLILYNVNTFFEDISVCNLGK